MRHKEEHNGVEDGWEEPFRDISVSQSDRLAGLGLVVVAELSHIFFPKRVNISCRMASFVTEVLANSGKLEKEDLSGKISKMSRKVEETKVL